MSKILIATIIALSLAACAVDVPPPSPASAAPYNSYCQNGEACHGHLEPNASGG